VCALYVLYALYVNWSEEPRIRRQMYAGRLQQIIDHVDRIERDLADVYELVARMQQAMDAEPESPAVADPDMRLSRDRSVTSACWDRRALIQEDSASL
jgi:hypothetical protein